jgi:hypothetical protein
VVRSRLGAPTGGAPLGQPGFDVRRRPPGGAVGVSLLMTLDPRSQAHGASGYLEVRQRARTRRWRLLVSGVLRDSGISARFPRTATVRIEASTPPLFSYRNEYTTSAGRGLSRPPQRRRDTARSTSRSASRLAIA